MPRLSPRAPRAARQEAMREEMHKFKMGKLHSGSGELVKNPKQAIAIGLSVSGQSRKKKKK